MGWIIIAIGVVFAGFGGAVAYSGLDYVQVERGWTAVISGTTMLSGGIIVVSIGVMTLKLMKIANLLQSEPALFSAGEETVGLEPSPAEPPPPKPPIPLEESLKAKISTAGFGAAMASSSLKTAPEPVSLSDSMLPVFGTKPAESPAGAPIVQAHESPTNSPPLASAGPVSSESNAADHSLDWLEDAIANVHEPAEPVPPVSRIVAPLEPARPVPVPAIKVPEPPSIAGPTVVGRYEAAGTSYAMYSDGSVEAENEHGVFRFSSMAELRAFIEEGQSLDGTAAT